MCRKQLERNYMTWKWNSKKYPFSAEICVCMQVISLGATLEPEWKFAYSYMAM
jgi:hypothetical protein